MKSVETTEILDFIKSHNATTRETAKHFGVSRQTISNRIANSKNKEVQEIMQKHFKYKSKRIK